MPLQWLIMHSKGFRKQLEFTAKNGVINNRMFFKGYVETKDKQCVEKFKNRTDFKNFEQVQSLPEFAGILAEDTVLIDIDDGETSDILFNIVKDYHLICRVYRTTRGKHFIFKNDPQNGGITSCKTHCKLAIGLTADIKVGYRSSYEVLKFNGKMREILYDTAENEQAQLVPQWLHPVKGKMDFVDMDAGDGRNQALFTYILTLQSSGFSVEDARECIRTINAYVLKEPLSDEELEVVLRDDAFKKPIFYNGNTFLFDKFATFLKNNAHIIRINNQLHIYKDGIYTAGYGEIEAVMIKHIPNLNRAKRSEVMTYLDLLIRDNTKPEDAHLIAFKNGLYNIIDGSFVGFTPEHIITNKIPWDYTPDATCPLVDNVLNRLSCNDAEIRALLEEVAGACLYRDNKLGGGKAAILVGDKHNGKSTYIEMIQAMLGDANISTLDFKELDDKFSTAMLFGKLANLGDDISDSFKEDVAMFKKIVTGQTIKAEMKGQNPFQFTPYAKLIFSANNIPRMKDPTGAAMRRLLIIPLNAKFLPTDPEYDPQIKTKLAQKEAVEYFIQLAISGLKRVLKNQHFTVSQKEQQAKANYEQENNPILAFIEDCRNDNGEIEGIYNEATSEVYLHYEEFCNRNGFRSMCKPTFSKQINQTLGTESKNLWINGKQSKAFVLP